MRNKLYCIVLYCIVLVMKMNRLNKTMRRKGHISVVYVGRCTIHMFASITACKLCCMSQIFVFVSYLLLFI